MDATTVQGEINEASAVGPVVDLEQLAKDAYVSTELLKDNVNPEDVAIAEVSSLSASARRDRWQSRRPSIEHLQPAVTAVPGELVQATGLMATTLLPLFDLGDRIVVERRTSLLPGNPWLDTIVGKVRSIDDESGVVGLIDEEVDPRSPGSCRFVSYRDGLHDFRLAPPKGNPFNEAMVKAHIKVLKAAEAADPMAPKRRGRGRPSGSKNRPKEVIQAEREAYKASQKKH